MTGSAEDGRGARPPEGSLDSLLRTEGRSASREGGSGLEWLFHNDHRREGVWSMVFVLNPV